MKDIPAPGPPTKYGFERWIDGNWHEAEGGVDFHVKAHTYAQACRKWAKEHGYDPQIRVRNAKSKSGTVQFCFIPVIGEPQSPNAEYRAAWLEMQNARRKYDELRAAYADPEEIQEALENYRTTSHRVAGLRNAADSPGLYRPLTPLPPEAAPAVE